MIRFALLVLLAALAGGCVSGDDAESGALRVVHAAPDAANMRFSFNGVDQGVVGYTNGSYYYAVPPGTYTVVMDEILPSGSDPSVLEAARKTVSVGVNDEATLVLGGSSGAYAFLDEIRTTTRGVPTAKARLQVVHAAQGVGAVDVYILGPDELLLPGSTTLASNVAYGAHSAQKDITASNFRVVVTAPGSQEPLFESASRGLPSEGTLLVAIVRLTGLDTAPKTGCGTAAPPDDTCAPIALMFLNGSGGADRLLDKDYPAMLRLANASPGAYALDAFVNDTAQDDTSRQDCDGVVPADPTDTFLEACAQAYRAVHPVPAPVEGRFFSRLVPDGYDLKVQETGAAARQAGAFALSLAAGGELTVLLSGLVADDATGIEDLDVNSIASTRRIGSAAQLRVIDASVAADALSADTAVSSDRLELYVIGACEDVADESPIYAGFARGFDTGASFGYSTYRAGDYQVALTLTDTARDRVPVLDDEGNPNANPNPRVLLSQRVTLAGQGVYTLVAADAAGGAEPLEFLSLDDAAAPAPACP